MTDLTLQPPLFHGLSSNEYPASRLRRALQTLAGDGEGVVAAGDFAVTPNSPVGMSVRVAPGRALVNGDQVTRQGVYILEEPTTLTVTIASNSSGNPRIDLVVLRDYDQAADGGSQAFDKGAVEVVQGTPAGSPVAPAVPASSIPLAQVAVANGAASISAGNITDRRPRWLLGGQVNGARLSYTAGVDQTIGTTDAKVLLTGTPSWEDSGGVAADEANSRIYLPRVGLWRVEAHVAAGTSAGVSGTVRIRGFGGGIVPAGIDTGVWVDAIDGDSIPAASATLEHRFGAVVNVTNTASYVELWAVATGASLTVSQKRRRMTATYLGPLA